MLRLLLLRHAKSDWSEPGLHDHDRPLNARGWKAADLAGQHIQQYQMVPATILCSTALRTRQTLMQLLPHLRADMKIQIMRDLYMQGDLQYIDTIRALGGPSSKLMLIGHNPAIQDTALELAGKGNPELFDQMEEKFPTAAMAVIDFEAHRWSEVTPKQGRLVSFFQPRSLQVLP
ncbi:histidine phosphatase family protein [Rhodobacteraceae bacterium RKSG542]|uniref:SixA phosphatase family protein n=1 Tax=Pseudovibrio flavus TaxID=2529854 RepID=UPI0012BB8E55|nr:histidine phosphatase family protein [Pseudovibrio flavus]MTI19255.1 histidine phosphatase family protein [Pseudovibrio flavus]